MLTWDEKTPYPFMQLKYDGHYVEISRNESFIKVVTRIGTDITDKVKFALLNVYRGLPEGVTIAGEIYVPGGDSSMVKSYPANLRFVGFAINSVHGEGYDKASLHFLAHCFAGWGIPFADFVTICEGDAMLAMAEKSVGGDIEGVVFKRGNTWDVAKWKPKKTIDLIICGYEDGQGKYFGQVGNIILKTCEGYHVAKASGFSDEVRLEISCNRRGYMGKIVEIEYQKVLSRGRLRHPRFKRFREDKTAENCPAYQDAELSKHWDK